MNVEILDLAKLDLLDGFHFYEGQQAGLGPHFLASIIRTLIPSAFTQGFI